MKAKRLLTALLIAVLISALFTFWLSRRVAKATRVIAPQKQQLYVAAAKTLDWMNRSIFVAIGERQPGEAVLHVYRLN